MSTSRKLPGYVHIPREAEQEICIGEAIRVRVVAAKAGWAEIAISAPRNLSIDRAEHRDKPANTPRKTKQAECG